MAPLKRSLPDANDESTSDSGSDIDSASKRRRTSLSNSSSGSSGGSSEEEEDIVPPALPWESAEVNEDELELQATQFIHEKYNFQEEESNVPSDHGIIERVDCFNFMCHEHFSVELGPLINFIVGKNGSGKSAILTALTLCLGGKASSTNRGQNLKSFIKEGKESATIIVRIKNQGDGAYMPDEFGKSIIVERVFSKSGAYGFKIKNEAGRIVSTKKADLDAITDFFNLQIDNPMNVLSQDMARQFLSSSSPAEKYKFFVKGVQLEQLDHDYRLIEEYVDQIKQKLSLRSEDVRLLREQRDKAKRRLELSDQRTSLRERVKNLRGQMAWAQVEEIERGRDSLQGEIDRIQENIVSAESSIDDLDAAYQQAEREYDTASQVLEEAERMLSQANDEKAEIKIQEQEEMNERHGMQAQQRQIHDHIKAAENRIKKLEDDIAEENRRLADIDGGNYARRQEELDERKAEAETARETYRDHQNNRSSIDEQIRQAQDVVNQRLAPINQRKADIEEAETLLKSLMRDRGQSDAGFSDRMPSLLKAINNEKSFARRPVGPVGHHVRLLKPEWSAVLEQSLNNTLSSFIVTSKKDMNILANIMHRVNCVCPILIGSEGHIDTSQHEPDSKFDTILRVLDIDDDLVRRQLIINHGVEQMVLIENVEDASKALFEGPRLRNVKRCLCIDASDRRRGTTLAYGRTGEPSQSPIAPFTGRARMRTDIDSQIRLQKENIQALKTQMTTMEKAVSASRAELERCKMAETRYRKEEDNLKIAVQRLDDEVDELTDALERDRVEDGRLEALKQSLEETQQEKQVSSNSLEESNTAMQAIMNRLKQLRRQVAEKDRNTNAQEEQVKIAENERLNVEQQRRAALANKNAALAQIEDFNQEKAQVERKKEEIVDRIQSYIEQASIVSPRVPVDEGETPDSLDRKLDKLYKDLDRFDQQMGASREEIAADLLKVDNAFKDAERQLNELEKIEQIFKHTINYRRERWRNFRAHISSRAKAQFTYLLSERSFRGRLLTDHENKMLDLQVEPDITKDSAGRGAKTLSGGEKSFSQVCLLLSLWEAMGSPIRCLDEFDVYMDQINRRMSIDMLMLAARRSIGRQFILITPGSRADINLAPDVRVKELAEPERGQSTLTFRQT
ncbi:hypothetical protein PISL3812_00622 [Talaromyces islandicus]|uniref:Rad50/SbcC-type AAA domain-containing protein n=1 Tax=Talaromyces islandicus TaxID=28573 RepID=A0A0U1LMC5_TALIS|nr:hypothetical protein PISL3812_00622 [Talaromyces islandicus]